ncbi:MAG: ribosome silencing factor [Burkholderiaceae bacterium]|nr:ribosome silencing factor [Burkholderiaceae bacterium]
MSTKTDIQSLQNLIVEALEDVKGKDITVFDTEHLSSLFERVIIVSGSSNRQTKALASSVRDSVRESGLSKPRVEGEANGEWIIVDCGAAVVHVMQPIIREYYRLEEIWGDKPVRIKQAQVRGLVKASEPMDDAEPVAKKASAKKSPAKKAPSRTAAKTAAKAEAKAAGRTAATAVPKPIFTSKAASPKQEALKAAKAKKAAAKKAPAKTTVVKKATAKTATPATKPKTVSVNKPKAAAKKTASKKTAAKVPTKAPAKPPAKPPAKAPTKAVTKSPVKPSAKAPAKSVARSAPKPAAKPAAKKAVAKPAARKPAAKKAK